MSDISRGHIGVKKIVALSRSVAVQAQAWVTENLFGVQGVVHPTPPDTTSVLRVPLISPQILPRTWQQSFTTNLLLTTLAVAAVPVPFAQADWPNPTRPVSAHGVSSLTTSSTPTLYAPRLLAQYDVSAMAVVPDGTAMLQFDDESPSELHASQGTAARRPVYKTNIFGSKPGVLIDATGANPSYFSIPSAVRAVLAQRSGTIAVVWKWFAAPPGGTSARFLSATDDAVVLRFAIRRDGSTPSNASTTYYNGTTSVSLGTVDDDDADGHVYARIDDGANVLLKFDLNTADTATNLAAYTPDLGTESRAGFGSTSISSDPSKGYLAEIRVWNYALSESELDAQITELRDKWFPSTPFSQTDWSNPRGPKPIPNGSTFTFQPCDKIETLIDTFNAGQDPALWTTTADSGSTVTFTNRRVEIQPPSNQASPAVSYGYCLSRKEYDLTNSSLSVELCQASDGTPTGNAGSGLSLRYDRTSTPRHQLGIGVYLTEIYFYRYVNGVYANAAAPITYSASAHRWLRLRHDGAQVLWETSADRVSWQTRATWTPSFAVSALVVELFAGVEDTTASPTAGIFDNVNSASDVNPFSQFHWPNPHGRALSTAEVAQRFDLVTLGTSPFNQRDWQNPRGPKPIIAGTEQRFDLATLGLDPFRPPVPELPSFPRSRQQPENQAPLNTTTLAPVVAGDPPFLQSEWPNPTLRLRQVVPQSHRPNVDPATLPDVGKPFLQDDWQNPRINPRYRQFLNSGRVLGEDPFPFTQTEWLNPLPKPLTRQGLTASQIFNTADVVNTKPFLLTDWQNPILRLRQVVPLSHRPDVDPATLPDAGKPFLQDDWQNPRINPSYRQFLNSGRVLGEEPFPFIQTDWPNPRGKRLVTAGIEQRFDLTTLGLNPFRPPVLELRSVPRRSQQPENQASLNTTTLAPVVAGDKPFLQSDWPNPTRRVSEREWGSTDGVPYAAFVIPPVKPFLQSDWPNPTRRVGEREWGSTDGVPYAAFVIPPVKPFLQGDWPNPTRRVSEREWGSTDGVPYAAFVIPPVVGETDILWPNWQRRRRR